MSIVKNISGLKEIFQDYDIFILDQWGVMHDGCNGYPDAIKCIYHLIENKKKLIIISNSSKKSKSTFERLPSFGFNQHQFSEIMTSGEMVWKNLIDEDFVKDKKLGKNCFHIFDKNKEDSVNFTKGLEKFNFVDEINSADFILGCTPFFNLRVIDYIPLLSEAIKNNLPFVCANPDFDTVESNSGKLIFCMGTIAALYENMGGQTIILGKPSKEIYFESTKIIQKINKSKILAIGDSLSHDIKGAIDFGIDSLLITSTGIHQNFFDKLKPIWESDKNTLKNLGIKPTFICSDFKF
jgi:HAD superfamily hydrolase (TIGR01459 family)